MSTLSSKGKNDNSNTFSKFTFIILVSVTIFSAVLINIELQNQDEGLFQSIKKCLMKMNYMNSYDHSDKKLPPVDAAIKQDEENSKETFKLKNKKADVDTPKAKSISENKLEELEEQIIPVEVKQKSDAKIKDNKDSNVHKEDIPPTKPSKQITDLYDEVVKLTQEILEEDPANGMIKELAPHLEEVLRDITSKKMEGIEASLLHIKEILNDLKLRLQDLKSYEIKSGLPADSGDTYEKKIPVDEVIPDPIYIAPRGSLEETEKEQKFTDINKQKLNSDNIHQDSKQPNQETAPKQAPEPTPKQAPEPTPKQAPEPTPKQAPEPTPKQAPEPAPKQAPKPAPKQASEPAPKQAPKPAPKQAPEPAPKQAEPAPKQAPEPAPKQESEPTPKQAPKPTPKQAPKPAPKQAPKQEFEPAPKQAPEPAPKQAPEPVPKHAPEPAPKQESVPAPKQAPEPAPKQESVPAPKQAPEPAPQKAAEPVSKKAEPDLENDSKTAQVKQASDAVENNDHAKIAATMEEIQRKVDAAYPLIDSDPKEAVRKFTLLNAMHPKKSIIILGVARALKAHAEKEKSNSILDQCISTYKLILFEGGAHPEKVPDDIMKSAGREGFERMDFRGQRKSLQRTMELLVKRFPGDVEWIKKLGYAHLLSDQYKESYETFKKVLEVAPNDTYAHAHMGYAARGLDDCEGSVKHLSFLTEEEGDTIMGSRYFLTAGDCRLQTGDREKAYRYYEEGFKRGYFISKDQRSLHNVKGLRSQPTWTLEETTHKEFLDSLEENWQKILAEGLTLLERKEALYESDKENLVDTGDWKQLRLFVNGEINETTCLQAPYTCSLLRPYVHNICVRGQVKFSVMTPGTHVHPHTGPTNTRLRAHLGLVIPSSGVKLRILDQYLTWTEGKVFVFDDSFEHEVWHDGDRLRLILMVDFYHPDLTEDQISEMQEF